MVDQSNDWSDKSRALMAWAVHAQTRRATYVASLPRAEKGLDCNCVCPACGGVLEAVNNGRDAEHYLKPNTLRPFFRHHRGQQGAECLVWVAQLAALKLLVESNEIDLPAPLAQQSVMGVSGTVYTQSSSGSARRARIVEQGWLDEHSARLVLDDGRVILVRLEGRGGFKDDGSADAVISVRVDDPEVATWPPEVILERVQLDGRWMCWERHWEDGRLQGEALALAEEEARRLLDLAPEGVALPDGLTQLQRSESVLHWVIKEILAKAGMLKVPAVRGAISRRMPDGQMAHRPISLPEMTLRLSDVRIETRLGGMVPDVMCRAEDAAGRFAAVELLLEVAVTHRVDDAKSAQIKEQGLACLELDVNLIGAGGRMSVDRLRGMVLGDPSNKRWINHPEMARMAQTARTELDEEVRRIESEQAQERARRTWFEGLSEEQAATEYLQMLRAWWRGRDPEERGGVPWTARQMASLMADRGLRGLDANMLSGRAGLLRRLDDLRAQAGGREGRVTPYGHFKAVYESPSEQRYVTWILLAIKMFKPSVPPEEVAQLNEGREQVKSSIARGETAYARPKQWDKLVGMMFPGLQEGLDQVFGTEAYAAKLARDRQLEARRAETERAARAEAARREEELRLGQAEIADAIEQVCKRFEWGPVDDGIPGDAEVAFFLLEKWSKGQSWSTAQIKGIVSDAWDARSRGVALRDWLSSRRATSAGDVHLLKTVLEKAWLVFAKSK